jgi:hypothetical protein
MPYPPRTTTSDALARAIYNHLAGTGQPGGGVNRMMVTVVTAGGTAELPSHVFVGFSGGVGGGGVRAALIALAAVPLFAAFTTTILPFDGAGALAHAPGGPVAAAPGHFQVAHGRHCAEPRALMAAAASGARINGMSTIWWGNVANGYPHPDGGIPTDPATGITIFAAPCQICAMNDDWIMARAQNVRDTARGLPRKSFESPI